MHSCLGTSNINNIALWVHGAFTYQYAIAAVAREKVLAVVDDGVLLHSKLMNSPYDASLSVNLHDGLPLNNYVIAFLDTPENRKLLNIINTSINQDKLNQIVNIHKKWLNEIQRRLLLVVSKNKLLLTEKEQQYLSLNPNIYVSYIRDSKPISFVNSEGQPDGISIDILNEISRLTGLNFIFENDFGIEGNDLQTVSLPLNHTKATPFAGVEDRHDDLPFSALKLDIDFVKNIQQSRSSRAIVRASLYLAKLLDLTTVAEGIEDTSIWKDIRSMSNKDTLAQGYFIARPMPADQLPEWKSSWEKKITEFNLLA